MHILNGELWRLEIWDSQGSPPARFSAASLTELRYRQRHFFTEGGNSQ